jgi:hypothetical protein
VAIQKKNVVEAIAKPAKDTTQGDRKHLNQFVMILNLLHRMVWKFALMSTVLAHNMSMMENV